MEFGSNWRLRSRLPTTTVTREQANRFALLRPRLFSGCGTSTCKPAVASSPQPCRTAVRPKSGILVNFGNLCRTASRKTSCDQPQSGSGCYKNCGHLFHTCSGSLLKRFSLFNSNRCGSCSAQSSQPCSAGCDAGLSTPNPLTPPAN